MAGRFGVGILIMVAIFWELRKVLQGMNGVDNVASFGIILCEKLFYMLFGNGVLARD